VIPHAASRAVLPDFPVRLFTAAGEQWEGMLREYALRGIGGTEQAYGGEEVARAGAALSVLEAAIDPAFGERCTLTLDVAAPGDFGVLQAILDDGLSLARAGKLLAFPALPEVVALRDWFCEQIVSQAAGAQPEAWNFAAVEDLRPDATSTEWERALAPSDDVAWLIGDDHNRILAASSAALSLLGWGDDLVGQRLLAVIPPQLREAHIAGFTRSVVTGGGDLLGRPLSVPALTRSGRQIPITLTLTRHPARHGRTVYLARLEQPTEA
jgi:PAS domain S-box-containing protein